MKGEIRLSLAYGLRLMAYGLWLMAYGYWLMADLAPEQLASPYRSQPFR